MNFETGKKQYQVAAVSFFAVIFFLQMFSFILSNEMNGVHFGKKRARLSSPVKQSVAFQMKYDSLEDVSYETESDNTENPVLKLNGFSKILFLEKTFVNNAHPKDEPRFSSTPPLFTLYRIFRI